MIPRDAPTRCDRVAAAPATPATPERAPPADLLRYPLAWGAQLCGNARGGYPWRAMAHLRRRRSDGDGYRMDGCVAEGQGVERAIERRSRSGDHPSIVVTASVEGRSIERRSSFNCAITSLIGGGLVTKTRCVVIRRRSRLRSWHGDGHRFGARDGTHRPVRTLPHRRVRRRWHRRPTRRAQRAVVRWCRRATVSARCAGASCMSRRST